MSAADAQFQPSDSGGHLVLPPLAELIDAAHVLSIPMRVNFRGIARRELMVFKGPAGWGEFGPFLEYGVQECVRWLRAGVEAAWHGFPPTLRDHVPVNATIPAVPASRVAEVAAAFPGVTTAKVKVAERGQNIADDVARVNAARDLFPKVRVDANGGWNVVDAYKAITLLTRDGELEYVEQPCQTVEELVELRRRLGGHVLVAADESIRKVEYPLRVVHAGGADVAVVKVAPLGGVRELLSIAQKLIKFEVPVVVSSAIDSAVGLSAGIHAAASLPELPFACGLGTSSLLVGDIAEQRISGGVIQVDEVCPEGVALQRFSVNSQRKKIWVNRLTSVYNAANDDL